MYDRKFLPTLIAVGIVSAFFGAVLGVFLILDFPVWGKNLSLPFFSNLSSSVSKGLQTRVVVDEQSAVINVVEQASPAVVSIVTKSVDFDPLRGPVNSEQGIGTGFIVKGSGVILTNNHVVSDEAVDYLVVTKDKKTYPVVKIFRDASNDIAILTLNASNLPTVDLGDSSKLKVGQKVVAIGNALGRFDNTVTTGVVSGIGRGVTASDPFSAGSETLENVIQTDAALNPGNSGGPLLDLSGKVIGINFAVTQGAQNIGFVIPINIAKPILDGFLKEGRIVKAFLGVGYRMIDTSIGQLSNLPPGAFVQTVVKGSPAEKAGLKAGDIITKINNDAINSDNPLSREINGKKVGDSINITVNRDGQTLNFSATLEEAPKS